MLIENLKMLFERDLNKLNAEITAYKDQTNLWKIRTGIKNSAGNLCLHLTGNLNTYIGAKFGKSGYIRNRELEFSLKDIPKSELIMMIEETIKVVDESLSLMKEEDLAKEYPTLVF